MVRLTWTFGLVLLGLVLMVGTAETQDAKKDKAKGQLPQGWKSLKLTPEQNTKIYGIQNEYRAKRDDLKKQITDLAAKERAEMFQILTADQKAQLVKLSTGQDGNDVPAKEKKIDAEKK